MCHCLLGHACEVCIHEPTTPQHVNAAHRCAPATSTMKLHYQWLLATGSTATLNKIVSHRCTYSREVVSQTATSYGAHVSRAAAETRSLSPNPSVSDLCRAERQHTASGSPPGCVKCKTPSHIFPIQTLRHQMVRTETESHNTLATATDTARSSL